MVNIFSKPKLKHEGQSKCLNLEKYFGIHFDWNAKSIKNFFPAIIILTILLAGGIQIASNEEVSKPPSTLGFIGEICEIEPAVFSLFPAEEGIGGEIEITEEESPKIVASIQLSLNPELPEWPIIYHITCPSYTQGYSNWHRGLDLINRKCKGNNIVFSVKFGIVKSVGWDGGYGKRIEIEHEGGIYTSYSHLSNYDVEMGDEVVLGQKIGTLGSTGKSTGIHLHFEVIYQGVKVNPDVFLNIE